MRMATPGHARLTLVRASPCLRLMRGLPGTTNCLLRARVSASFPRLALPGATSTGDPVGGGRRWSCSWNAPRRWMSARTRWWPASAYPTFTSSLGALADWLAAEGVTQVVMEATGQYWKPCWYVLEERGFQLLLAGAHHVKILPGRKTDVGDAAWLCELLECGLLRGSFVPAPAIRQLRDLTRYRKRLIQAHSGECQRIQKTLQDAGIKLDSVAADILGVSGRAMLKALVAGQRDPQVLAELARRRLRAKLPNSATPSAAASATTTPCWSGWPWNTWSTWSTWSRRSPPSTPASTR